MPKSPSSKKLSRRALLQGTAIGIGSLGTLDPLLAPAALAQPQTSQLGPEALAPFNHFPRDRKSTRLNSSHPSISYAVFCLKKKNKPKTTCSSIIHSAAQYQQQ